MTNDDQRQVIEALANRGAANPCGACGHDYFALADDMVQLTSSDQADVHRGPTIPCALLFCKNCGHARIHALGALGLGHIVAP